MKRKEVHPFFAYLKWEPKVIDKVMRSFPRFQARHRRTSLTGRQSLGKDLMTLVGSGSFFITVKIIESVESAQKTDEPEKIANSGKE